MKPVIEVENLSKMYRVNLSEGQAGGTDLRAMLARMVKTPLHRLRHGAGHSTHTKEFWALRDIQFKVNPGEVLGIIGRNGAGKSTLLKILSRITYPTTGKATIRGRVRSLLEVGTGFHEDLTGRENVYLNGMILGMSRREIHSQFDNIVEFAEVERFIDTPVKRYSSGMRMRLGFAVAAFLQPEILIIDEVLAVGDVDFQRRCLGKMQEVSAGGRTVLFVSHNMRAVRQLTDRCLLIEDGQIVSDDSPEQSIQNYYAVTAGSKSGVIEESMHSILEGVRFLTAEFTTLDGTKLPAPLNLTPVHLEVELEVMRKLPSMIVMAGINTPEENSLIRLTSDPHLFGNEPVEPGRYRLGLEFTMPLRSGRYILVLRADISLRKDSILSFVPRAKDFELVESRQISYDEYSRHYAIPLFPSEGEWSRLLPADVV